MKEIKFRAWHINSQSMLYETPSSIFAWLDEKQPIKIMQYTGLHDKRGKEIYEGDILLVVEKDTYNPFHKKVLNHHSIYGHQYICSVVWDDNDASFKIAYQWADTGIVDNLTMPSSECEVIGNIYELVVDGSDMPK